MLAGRRACAKDLSGPYRPKEESCLLRRNLRQVVRRYPTAQACRVTREPHAGLLKQTDYLSGVRVG